MVAVHTSSHGGYIRQTRGHGGRQQGGAPAFIPDFYVASLSGTVGGGVNGSPSGNGSVTSPWDLQTALNQPAALTAGKKVGMRGGTYIGRFLSNVNGTASNPIVFRQYPGERATVDGDDGTSSTVEIFQMSGSYTWFWGFEIFCSRTGTREVVGGTEEPPPPGIGFALYPYGDGTRLINLIVHDTSQGVYSGTLIVASEIYGCLFYYNGWNTTLSGGTGHGIYSPNQGPGHKRIVDNVIVSHFGVDIHAFTTSGYLEDLDFIGNTVYGGRLGSSSGPGTQFLVGSSGVPDPDPCSRPDRVVHDPVVLNNYAYIASNGTALNLGYTKGVCNPTLQGNYFVGGSAFDLSNPDGTIVINGGNTFYGTTSGFVQGDYPDNTYYSSEPTTNSVFVRPNGYETGRANIAIFNWQQLSTVSVNVSSVLAVGTSYQLRNAQDYYGPLVLSGTYNGGTLSVPMNGLNVATPIGWTAPANQGPKFGAFILLTV